MEEEKKTGRPKGTKLKDKPKISCVHYGETSETKVKNRNNEENIVYCRLTTYEKCDPETCPWYTTREMQAASYEKARQNYIKNHGKDEYFELGYGPRRRMLPRTEEE